ncbi:MAG: hypothetical protein HXY23_11615 [Parvularculaceae bacterium]|jgi:hypothetical protein|nr:hypothetical protein [Parvularculaceae bacterium]
MAWFFAGALALLSLCGLAYWAWSRRVRAEIAEGAAHAWEKLSANDPELLAGLDRSGFDAIYARVNFPRYPGYMLAAAATFVASLPATLALLSAGALLMDRFGVAPDAVALADQYLVEDGKMRVIRSAPPEAAAFWIDDVSGFYFFFGVIASWVLVLWFYMRRYHQRRPGHLRDEILLRRKPPA